MYKALVCRINVYPHPDSKYTEIQCGSAKGHTVVISKKVNSGDLGIFFPPDGKLSHEFCLFNKLYRKDPETGEPIKGGYLEENGRIKAIKFSGVKSEGLWMPIEKATAMFAKADGSLCVNFEEMEEGAEIDSFGGIQFCEKYYTPATLRQMSNGVAKDGKPRLRDRRSYVFPEHMDTCKFKNNFDKIPEGSLVIVTEKLHGTSARVAFVETVNENYSNWQKKLFSYGFGKWFKFKPKVEKFWDFLVGSRTKVLEADYEKDKQKYRFDIANQIRPFITKNEIVYGEIVGFTHTNKAIMGSMGTDAVGDKEFSKRYGKVMVYRYGCEVGQCDFYVYRITNLNPEGKEIELSWNQVKKRCKEMGLKHVPEVIPSRVFDCVDIREDMQVDYMKRIEAVASGPSSIDGSHIKEGVCVRVENDNGIKIYKHKSFDFLLLEGRIKDNDSYIDLEETS